MNRPVKQLFFIALFFIPSHFVSATEPVNGEKLFKQKCSLCHAVDKKKLGPAVKAMNKNEAVLRQIINKGKNSMPAYEEKLTNEQIEALLGYLLEN